jgi:hypothetical protein
MESPKFICPGAPKKNYANRREYKINNDSYVCRKLFESKPDSKNEKLGQS